MNNWIYFLHSLVCIHVYNFNKIIQFRRSLFCLAETNQCSPNPCKNGGTCTERSGKFECTCTIGFKGLTCEGNSVDLLVYWFDDLMIWWFDDSMIWRLSDLIIWWFIDLWALPLYSFHKYWIIVYTFTARSSCSSNPCLNGGTCNEENIGYSCTCRVGYKNVNCQGLSLKFP